LAGEGEATLRASNGAITVDVKVRLYERCPAPGVIVLVGEEVLDSLKLCDSLVSFSLNTSTYICTMKTGTSQWYLHAVEDHRLGDEFKVPTDPNFKPVEFKTYDFLKGLQVAAAAMSSAPAAANMYGVGFGPDSVQSTDAQCIAVYKQGTGSATFTVPAPMVLPLKKLLTEGYADSVQLRINSNQVEVTVGEDVAVFGQMPDFVKLDVVLKALEVYTPTFLADRWSFVGALTRAELFGEDLTSITIARGGDDLQFVAMKGLRKISEGTVQVTWLTPDPAFSMKIDSKALRGVIDALDGNIIDFGTGTFRGMTFCRLNEHDRTLYVLNMIR